MGSKSKSSNKGGGNRGKVLQQDYSSFKTPEATKAALNRQKNILDRNRTSTGAFANQADDLRNAGYTLNDTRDKVMSPTGGTIAGINKNNQLFSGSREVSDILQRNLPQNVSKDRVANTNNVLNQIYGGTQGVSPQYPEYEDKILRDKRGDQDKFSFYGGVKGIDSLDEMSKFGEEQINRAFDGGRGVKFANNPNPADPFRVTSSQPTFLEMLGDVGRALGGGTAEQTIPDLSIALQPRNKEGIIGQLFNTLPSLRMIKEAFGGEEEEQLNALQMQRQGYANDPYSVPTGPALPLDYLQGGFNRLQDLSPQDIIQENISTLKESSQQESINNMNFRDPIYPAELIQQDALNRFPGNDFQIKLKPKPPVPNIYESTGASAGSPFDTGTPLPLMEEKDPNILDKFLNLFQGGSNEVSNILGTNQGNDGGSSGGGGESSEPDVPPAFDPNDPFANLDPQYLKLLEAFQSAGGGNLYSQQDIVDYFRKMKYLAYGGSVAPQSGPMSEGIGTLYNTR